MNVLLRRIVPKCQKNGLFSKLMMEGTTARARIMSSSSSSLPLPTGDEKYNYQVFKKAERAEVLRFLEDNFRLDEPLNRASGMREDEIKLCLESTLDRVLKNEVSIIARSKESNKIVGCMLNSVWRREEEPSENQNQNQNEKESEEKDFEFGSTRKSVAMIGEILNELHNEFWNLRPDQNIVLHFEISSVCKNHQRRGIASKFMNWTEQPELLKSVNATGIAAEATSFANQMLLARRGYVTVATTLLASKVDPDTGKQLLVCDDGTDRVNLVFKEFPTAKL